MRWDSILAYCLSFINQQWNHTTTPCRAGRSSVATRRGSCQYKDVLGSRACDAMRGLLYEACKPGGPALWPCALVGCVMCGGWQAGVQLLVHRNLTAPACRIVADRRGVDTIAKHVRGHECLQVYSIFVVVVVVDEHASRRPTLVTPTRRRMLGERLKAGRRR